MMQTQKFMEMVSDLIKRIKSIPRKWNGIEAILEMKEAGYPHWRQMEWIGFYFQYLCESRLSGLMKIPGPRYGRVTFDGFYEIPWDFKTHVQSSSSQVIVNDLKAIRYGMRDYGSVGLILASGKATFDDEQRTFYHWHERLKGGPSPYVKQRKARGARSRRRKVEFLLEEILFLLITPDTLERHGEFQKGFRNSNGNPRRLKFKIYLKNLDGEILYRMRFK